MMSVQFLLSFVSMLASLPAHVYDSRKRRYSCCLRGMRIEYPHIEEGSL